MRAGQLGICQLGNQGESEAQSQLCRPSLVKLKTFERLHANLNANRAERPEDIHKTRSQHLGIFRRRPPFRVTVANLPQLQRLFQTGRQQLAGKEHPAAPRNDATACAGTNEMSPPQKFTAMWGSKRLFRSDGQGKSARKKRPRSTDQGWHRYMGLGRIDVPVILSANAETPGTGRGVRSGARIGV